MNNFLRFVILLAFILSLLGCHEMKEITNEGEKTSTQPSETTDSSQEEDDEEPFYPLIVNDASFIEVIDWYDDESILYLTDENGQSHLKRYHLITKEEEYFFSIDEPIVNVEANVERSQFAIQTASYTGASPLYIVDRLGNIQFQKDKLGETYSFFWNPYDEQQLLIVSFLPDWQFELYLLSLKTNEFTSISLPQTFFQWLDDDKLAYLDWDADEPSFRAPLYLYDLNTGEQSQLAQHIIAMFSFANQTYFVITVNTVDDLASKYTFYKNFEFVAELNVPVLNTYSEQWWIPFFDYDHKEEVFYYLSPYESGDFFEYDKGFQLTAFDLKTGEKTNIIEIKEHAPFKLSPDGEKILYGNQLESMIDLEMKQLSRLVQWANR